MSTTATERTIRKVLRPGTVPSYDGRRMSVYVEVSYRDGRLSLTGVEGPKRNGNAAGGCGQIDASYAHRDPAHDDHRTSAPVGPEAFVWAPGWDAAKWLDMLEVWHDWHLNDMRAGCEHQRATWDIGAQVTVWHWQLESDTLRAQNRAKADAAKRLEDGEAVAYDAETLALVAMPWRLTSDTDEAPPGYKPRASNYGGPSETKAAGWVRPSEHPAGLLTKACEVCGYAYGSAWRAEEVPLEVLDFLDGLPESDKDYPWSMA